MNKNIFTSSLFVTTVIFLLTSLSGCGAIEGIFKAGMWIGILGVVAVIGIIFFLVKAFGGGK